MQPPPIAILFNQLHKAAICLSVALLSIALTLIKCLNQPVSRTGRARTFPEQALQFSLQVPVGAIVRDNQA
jgi:hypothetical protein